MLRRVLNLAIAVACLVAAAGLLLSGCAAAPGARITGGGDPSALPLGCVQGNPPLCPETA